MRFRNLSVTKSIRGQPEKYNISIDTSIDDIRLPHLSKDVKSCAKALTCYYGGMEITEVHLGLRLMISGQLWYEGFEQYWYNAAIDWLYYEASKPYTGDSHRIKASLSYPRELASTPDPKAYPLSAVYEYVRASNLTEDEVLKFAEYLAGLLDSNDCEG
jgi:hypothetical protein